MLLLLFIDVIIDVIVDRTVVVIMMRLLYSVVLQTVKRHLSLCRRKKLYS